MYGSSQIILSLTLIKGIMHERMAIRQSTTSVFYPWLAKITTNYNSKVEVSHCNGVLLNASKILILEYFSDTQKGSYIILCNAGTSV